MDSKESSTLEMPKVESLIIRASQVSTERKFRATLEWTIDNFLTWISLKENETSYKRSQPYVLLFDDDKIKWTFSLDLRPADGNTEVLNLWITSQNPVSLTIESDVIAKDQFEKPFIKQMSLNIVQANQYVMFHHFLSKKLMRTRAQDFLPNGFLKLEISLSITQTDVQVTNVVTKTEMENYDAPESQQDVKESLWNDRTSTADFELICDNKTFPCHKIVLACRSDVFKAMFNNPKAIENTENKTTIANCDPDDLFRMLMFMYQNKLSNDNDLSSTDLLMLADRYNVVGLRVECEKHLSREINATNVFGFLSISTRITAPFLSKNAARFIFKHLDQLEGSKDWNEMVKREPDSMSHIFKFRSQ